MKVDVTTNIYRCTQSSAGLMGPRSIHTVRFVLLAVLAFGISALSAKAQQIVCDGQTDTTAAINAALAKLPPGGTLTLPSGVCMVSASITGFVSGTSPFHPTTLRGSGLQATTIRAINLNDGTQVFPFNVIQVGKTVSNSPTVTTGANYVTIANLVVDGGIHTPTTSVCDVKGDNSGSGVYVLTSSHVNVLANKFQNVIGGLTIMGSSNTLVTANLIDSVQQNGMYVVGKNGCEKGSLPFAALGNTIVFNKVENVSQYTPAGSGQTVGKHGWDGIDLEAGASDTTVAYNSVNGDDILVNCQSTTYCYGNTIKGNVIRNSLNVGVDVQGSQEDFTVDANIIATTNWGGIDVNGPATVRNNPNNVISNNILTMTDQGDPPTYPGKGNPGVPYFGGTYCAGINVKSTGQIVAGQPQHLVVSNNHVSTTFTAMPTYPAVCVYGPVGNTVQIINNVFPNRSGSGNSEVYIDPRSSAVISGNVDGNL